MDRATIHFWWTEQLFLSEIDEPKYDYVGLPITEGEAVT